jgi:hypothetical protein
MASAVSPAESNLGPVSLPPHVLYSLNKAHSQLTFVLILRL